MARLPAWAEEPEVNAFAAAQRPPSGSRALRIVGGLFVVGVATFVAAYYLPLHRAHTALTSEHRALAQKVQTLEAGSRANKTEIDELSRTKAKLELESSEREAAAGARDQKVAQLKKDLSSKLEKSIAKGGVALTVSGERLIVGVSEGLLFVPNKSDLSPKGKSFLCELAKGIGGSGSLAVGSVTSGEAPAAFDSVWEFTAARAASAAAGLEEKCGVAGARLSAVGKGTASSKEAQRDFGKLPNRLELEIIPAS